MNKTIIFIALITLFSLNSFVYAELRDPKLRDEDISNTIVSVNVEPGNGLYKYTYTIESPDTNKGIINDFLVDVSCDIQFDEVEIPVEGDRLGYNGNKSEDGQHVPVEIFAGYGTSNIYSITSNNHALWNIYLKPGETITNVYLISPAPPGERTYTLIPYMDTAGWDYNLYDEDDPAVPWIGDFTITDTVIGPSCSEDQPPPSELFLGSGKEPFNINGLLSYSTPEQDPIYLDSINDSIKIHIYYSESIQKKFFKAKLNGADISDKFSPMPGTNEIIEISGQWGKLNKLIIFVPGVTDGRVKGVSQDKRPEQSFATPAQERATRKFDEFKLKDVDAFHIWLKE